MLDMLRKAVMMRMRRQRKGVKQNSKWEERQNNSHPEENSKAQEVRRIMMMMKKERRVIGRESMKAEKQNNSYQAEKKVSRGVLKPQSRAKRESQTRKKKKKKKKNEHKVTMTMRMDLKNSTNAEKQNNSRPTEPKKLWGELKPQRRTKEL